MANYKSKRRTNLKPQKKEIDNTKYPEESQIKSRHNDVSWYTRNNQLLTDAASISYGAANGAPIDLGSDYLGNPSQYNYGQSMPGILALETLIGPGISKDNASAVNVAARNIYSFVRHKNSGHANYDSPDLMMYLLAMDSIYAFYNHYKRAYGIVMQYRTLNRYYPDSILRAMKIDPDDFRAHIADYRYLLNAMCQKINTLCVPSTMSYMIRHSWMFSNVWKDSEDEKAQLICFVPYGFYRYVETSMPSTLNCDVINYDNTFEGFKFYFDRMLSAIIESEDFNIMSGDILKAYGEGSLFKVSPITDDYTVVPVYNYEVLSQIENCTILPVVGDCNITNVVDTNTITWNPSIRSGSLGWACKRLINMHIQNVSPADTMVATRLMVPVSKEDISEDNPNEAIITITGCGSELITNAKIYYKALVNSSWQDVNFDFNTVFMLEAEDDSATIAGKITTISKFDYHPVMYITHRLGDPSGLNVNEINFVGIQGDIDNYTIISNDTLNKLHEVALLSEFGISGN